MGQSKYSPVWNVDARVRQSVERRALLHAYRHGDLAARDRLIEAFMPLVRAIARRHAGRGELIEDLEQVGTIGLLKALDRFDPDRSVELMTYVFPSILGEVKRHFRDRAWAVKVPRRKKELYFRVTKIAGDLTSSLGRAPTTVEIAVAAGIPEEEIAEALEVGGLHSARPLTAFFDGDEQTDDALTSVLAHDESGYEATEHRFMLDAALRVLNDREKHVINLRFYDDLTQQEIADRVGVSQMHISRLISRSLAKMGNELGDLAADASGIAA
jgi:RNA polymerase sigma-B factor